MPLSYYGQFSPPVDFTLHTRYFGDRRGGVCVECGAFDGVTDSSCKLFEESLGWKAYNLEPMPSAFRRLVQNRPLSRNVNAALSNKQAKASFLQVTHPKLGVNFGNSSLGHSPQHLQELRDIGCTFNEVEVDTTTWVEFVRLERLSVVDLLVLDVEGHELQVLEGMVGCEVLPAVMCVEFGHISLVEITRSMDALGYALDHREHINAFFVRKV
jgi:FkbM family methyltransferase